MNLALFGALPPDKNQQTDASKVEVRQMGEDSILVCFTQEKLAVIIPDRSAHAAQVIEWFVPRTTLYFFDPYDTSLGPCYVNGEVPVFAAMSMDPTHY